MKVKQFIRNGSEFFTDEHGNVLTRAQAKEGVWDEVTSHRSQVKAARPHSGKSISRIEDAESDRDKNARRRTTISLSESNADTAAAKTMAGHFVRDNTAGYGAPNVYKVDAVADDGSATLEGPIGKGGTKTVSHSDLVKNHTDLGDSATLDQVQESARDARLDFRIRTLRSAGLTEAEARIAAVGR